jgi:hypothetical protein
LPRRAPFGATAITSGAGLTEVVVGIASAPLRERGE